MSFRMLAISAIVAVATWSSAQYVDQVTIETDEFTGEISCYQTASASATRRDGLYLSLDDQVLVVVVFHHVDNWSRDTAFNMFGKMGRELVYFRFPDGEVLSFEPFSVEGDMDLDLESAILIGQSDLVDRLLSANADVRVRFRGPDGDFDFTLPHALLLGLAEGFGAACLD